MAEQMVFQKCSQETGKENGDCKSQSEVTPTLNDSNTSFCTEKGKTSAKSKPSSSGPPKTFRPAGPSPPTGFNKECLTILSEMNSTSNKVEKLSDRVDNLYDDYEQSDYQYDYGYMYDPECQDDSFQDQEDHISTCISEKHSIHKVEEGDDVFSTFIKKFKKTDNVDAKVNQNLADMINSTFREGMPDEIYNDVTTNISRLGIAML